MSSDSHDQTQPPASDDALDFNGETLIRPAWEAFETAATLDAPRSDRTREAAPSPHAPTHVAAPFRSARDAGSAPKSAPPEGRRVFGDYEILQELAQGGMGVVYKARQRKLNRLVALKMILAGRFANQMEVERFYVEAEAAANLRHPHIVDVYEVGEVDGQHFFSMEYIEGQSLSDLVRRQPLEPAHAARLVKTIAETVQFAHDQGVIHRDLKPSNVLLDRQGAPKITDFGLAKRTDGGGSQLTMTGAIIGTPSYMPPEQARGAEVGPLSDLYSTGAILYELLTAAPPFSAANPFDTIKQVIEVEPVAPRVRNPSIPRDLETICLKCLQKEPARRYASAGHLAEELGRFLEGRPIEARPIGALAKLWRWCKRNPVVSALCLLLILGGMAFVGGITTSLVITRAALADARQSFHHTRRAIDELFTLVSESTLLNQPGAQALRKEILLKARDLYHEVLAHRGDDRGVRDELARSYFRLGRIMQEIDSPQEALAALQTARSMQTEFMAQNAARLDVLDALGDTLQAIGKSYENLGDHDRALAAYQETAEVRRRAVGSAADNAEFRRKLINTYMNLAVIEKMRGDGAPTAEAALPFYRQAHRQFLNAQAEREAVLHRSPDSENLRLDLARGYFNLANVALQMELDREAIEHLHRAVDEFDWLIAQSPQNLEHQYLRAMAVWRLGDCDFFAEDWEGALARYDQAGESLRVLTDQNPDVHKYAAALAAVYSNQGASYTQLRREDEARQQYRMAIDVLRRLTRASDNPSYRRDLGKTLCDLAEREAVAGQRDDARRHAEESLAMLAALVAAHPDSPDYADQRDRAQALLDEIGSASRAPAQEGAQN